MITLPPALQASDVELIQLPGGAEVRIPKARPDFQLWKGEKPANDYGGKAILDFAGRPLFAELVILNTLIAAGWSGVWIDTYRKNFRDSEGEETTLPKERKELLACIYAAAGSSGGSFDVYAWRGEEVLFAEAKRTKKDQIRESQVKWLAAALSIGVPSESFLIVEWSAE